MLLDRILQMDTSVPDVSRMMHLPPDRVAGTNLDILQHIGAGHLANACVVVRRLLGST
jgi:hypothetical protein